MFYVCYFTVSPQASAPSTSFDPDSWPATAAAAVQQAEFTLLKCKAAVPSPDLQQQQQQRAGGVGRALPVSSSRRSLLFELAGVHCCCSGGGQNTAPAKRRVSGAAQQGHMHLGTFDMRGSLSLCNVAVAANQLEDVDVLGVFVVREAPSPKS